MISIFHVFGCGVNSGFATYTKSLKGEFFGFGSWESTMNSAIVGSKTKQVVVDASPASVRKNRHVNAKFLGAVMMILEPPVIYLLLMIENVITFIS